MSGFRVSGQANVGVVAFEGDWGITGDQFSINSTAQTDPAPSSTSSSTNFFTSYAQNRSQHGGSNNFSVDAKQFDVSTSVIKTGDTSANVTFSTSGDSYLATNFVMSVPVPSLQITKSASPTTVHSGDTVTYTITVTNPVAGSTATNVAVTDPVSPACNRTIGNVTGGTPVSYTCTGTAGSSTFTNVATVTGTNAQGDALSGSAQATVTVLNPKITITKTTDKTAYRAGQTVTFTITVTNTGDAALSAVTVADPAVTGCARVIGALAVGASTNYTCTATAPVTGNSNTANVTGADSLGRAATATATVPVPIIAPALTLAKTAAPTTVTAAGQTVTYSFRVTNSGDSTVNAISIADTFTAPAAPVPDRSPARPPRSRPERRRPARARTPSPRPTSTTDPSRTRAVANGSDIVGGAVASNTSTANVAVTRTPALTIKKTRHPGDRDGCRAVDQLLVRGRPTPAT